MKYYVADYRTSDGSFEYIIYCVFASRRFETAIKWAMRGKRIFNGFMWVETCRFKRIEEIPKAEYMILKKYLLSI
jgi:hypothetical protein